MAEAGGVAGLQSNGPKFFCHKCNHEIPHVSEDFTCPICGGGFIEEVQETAGTPGGHQGQNPAGGGGLGFDGAEMFGGADFLQQILRTLSSPGGPGGGSGGGPNIRFQQGPGGGGGTGGGQNSYRRTRSEGSGTPGSNSHHFSFVINAGQGGGGNTGGAGAGAGQNANPDNPMEHVLFTFLNDLISGLGGGAAVGGLPVLSNLGDYVWGRDGLDAIVTQLMNQMEGTGPPPLPTEKIDHLPDVKIDQDHVDRKMQCSVCWDDFALNEQVKQLECEHLYHPDCIIPWLKLHGTCPICRKDLTGEVQEDTNAAPSPRFEGAGNPNQSASSESSSESLRSSGTTSSDSIGGRQPGHHSSSNQTANNPSSPAASLLNQLFNPLMFGQGHVPGGGSVPSNPTSRQQDSSGQGQQGRRQPDGSGRTQGPGSGTGGGGNGGLDNMDLDFD